MEADKKIMRILLIASFILLAFELISTIPSDSLEMILYRKRIEANHQANLIAIAKKDSIKRLNDSIENSIRKQKLEKMAEIEISSIFAGLHFGDTENKVKTTMTRNRIIQIPVEDGVDTVYIDSYDAKYHKGRLVSLILYSDNDYLFRELYELYSRKYGEGLYTGIIVEGVNYGWHFSNCRIQIKMESRPEYEHWERSLTSDPHLYYNNYRGYKGGSLTKDPYFLKITYEDTKHLRMIEREKELADSLANVKRLKAIEAEKELARKLTTEVPTNI